jgi:hypothetical protein
MVYDISKGKTLPWGDTGKSKLALLGLSPTSRLRNIYKECM